MNGIELGMERVEALSAKNLIFQGDGGPTPATQAPGPKGIPPGSGKTNPSPPRQGTSSHPAKVSQSIETLTQWGTMGRAINDGMDHLLRSNGSVSNGINEWV